MAVYANEPPVMLNVPFGALGIAGHALVDHDTPFAGLAGGQVGVRSG